MSKPVVSFAGYQCHVVKTTYGGTKEIALVLQDAHDGSPVATATVRIPKQVLGENEVFIKNYSENEGLDQVLVAAGVIELTGRSVGTGYVVVPVARLLI